MVQETVRSNSSSSTRETSADYVGGLDLRNFLGLTIVMLLALPAVLCSCRQEKPSGTSEQWVKVSGIKQYPTRQSKLTDEQLARLRKLHTNLAEVDNSSLDKWVEDFEKDRDPEKEIRVWESIAAAYKRYSSAHALTPQARKEVFGVLLLRSGTANQAEILKHANLTLLTEKQARDVMADYKDEAMPIELEKK